MFNFINYPVVRFKKAHLNKEYIYKYFITDEQENNAWRDSIIDAVRESDIGKANKLLAGAKISLNNYMLRDLFTKFTYDEPNMEFIEKILKDLIKGNPKTYKTVEMDSDKIIIESAEGMIIAAKLTSYFPAFKDILPDIGNEKRVGKCHTYAIKTAISWNLPIPIKVATGYIKPFSNKDKILHTWLEIVDENKNYVLDPSRNLLMNKKAYYINNAVSSSVYKISKETIRQEEDIIYDMARYGSGLSKLYFANRNQALAIYKQLLKEEQKEREADPLYQAAKTMSEGFKRKEELEKKRKFSERGE